MSLFIYTHSSTCHSFHRRLQMWTKSFAHFRHGHLELARCWAQQLFEHSSFTRFQHPTDFTPDMKVHMYRRTRRGCFRSCIHSDGDSEPPKCIITSQDTILTSGLKARDRTSWLRSYTKLTVGHVPLPLHSALYVLNAPRLQVATCLGLPGDLGRPTP
jgi:hypothetical protein